ncbi:hypothetical protein D9M70_445580 [compost metagenome]
MVVVVVGDEHDVDRRQIVKLDAGGVVALRSGKGERAGATRPDGVGENVHAVHLDEQRRVADHRHAQAFAFDAEFGFHLLEGTWIVRRPACLATSELPAQQISHALGRPAAGIEEARPVEMVGDGASIVWIVRFLHPEPFGMSCDCMRWCAGASDGRSGFNKFLKTATGLLSCFHARSIRPA